MPGPSEEPHLTQFLNVDLDIYSRRSLKALVENLGNRVFVLYEGLDRGQYVAKLELSKPTKDADATIRELCRLINRLPEPDRILWDRATKRDFSVGIRAGSDPPSCDFEIEAKTIQLVADLGGRIVLTVYRP